MKMQMLKVTRGSLRAALLAAVLNVVEDVYEEDVELGEVTVPYWPIEADPRGLGPLVEVTVGYPGREGLLGERTVEAGGFTVRVVSKPDYLGDLSILDYYRHVAVDPLREDARDLRGLAAETARTSVEYMAVYLYDGRVLLLEGETLRVRIPFIEAAAVYHTHPEGGCGFSAKDVESALDLMVAGGVGEAAVTTKCAIVMYRRGFVLEEDYIELRKWLRKPGRPPSLRSIAVEMVTY